MNDDMVLVRAYAAHNSEVAFAALVSRHISLVHSAALRQVRNPHLAAEITQTVFIILARKAGSLNAKTILPGWLYRTATFVSADALKIQRRREQRELEAGMQVSIQETQPEIDEAWDQLSPLLDGAMAQLKGSEREVLVLRFFQNKHFKEIGDAMGVQECAAQKRVERALEKLRAIFLKHGVRSTTTLIAGAMAANSVQATPAALTGTVTAVAITKGATATGLTLTLIKGALNFMAWTKAKTAIIIGASVLLAAGVGTLTVMEIAHLREDAVWNQITAADVLHLNAAPPIVSIRPAKLGKGFGTSWISNGSKQMGFNKSVGKLLQNAYQIREPRIIFPGKPPEGKYDYIDCVSHGQMKALQDAIRDKFGLVGKKEMRDIDVFILKVANPRPPSLKPTAQPRGINLNNTIAGQFVIRNEPSSNLAFSLEQYLKTPVIDQTGLTERYDADLAWDASDQDFNPEGLKQAVFQQLGLNLIADHQTIEMLVVEKVK